jgi:hypothetical protein
MFRMPKRRPILRGPFFRTSYFQHRTISSNIVIEPIANAPSRENIRRILDIFLDFHA